MSERLYRWMIPAVFYVRKQLGFGYRVTFGTCQNRRIGINLASGVK